MSLLPVIQHPSYPSINILTIHHATSFNLQSAPVPSVNHHLTHPSIKLNHLLTVKIIFCLSNTHSIAKQHHATIPFPSQSLTHVG
jgi:hypothetical protein